MSIYSNKFIFLNKCSNIEKLDEYLNKYKINYNEDNEYNEYIKNHKEVHIKRNVKDMESLHLIIKYLSKYNSNIINLKTSLYFDVIFEITENEEYINEIRQYHESFIFNNIYWEDKIDKIHYFINSSINYLKNDYYYYRKPIGIHSFIFCIDY